MTDWGRLRFIAGDSDSTVGVGVRIEGGREGDEIEEEVAMVDKAWFTLRHTHKHEHKHKHNECSHLLHKHKNVTYVSPMSSRKKPREYGTRHVFKMAEDEILLVLLLQS